MVKIAILVGHGTLLLMFQNRELQIMRPLDHCNIVKLKYFFYSSGDQVSGVLTI